MEVTRQLDCDGELLDAAFAPNGERVALLTKDDRSDCFVSCVSNGNVVGGFERVKIGTGYWSINWNSSTSELVAVASDGSVTILDAVSGAPISEIPRAYDGPKRVYLGHISPKFFQFMDGSDFISFQTISNRC